SRGSSNKRRPPSPRSDLASAVWQSSRAPWPLPRKPSQNRQQSRLWYHEKSGELSLPVDERTQISVAPAPVEGKRDRAYLVVLAGSSVGEMYKVEGDKTIIGRGGRAQIRLLDEGISREHAQIVIEGNQVLLEDMGSTNGTYCNGLKVERKVLADGDKILVG